MKPPGAGDGFIEDGHHLLRRRLVGEQAPGEGEAGEDVDDDGEAEPKEAHERLDEGDVDHEDVIRSPGGERFFAIAIYTIAGGKIARVDFAR